MADGKIGVGTRNLVLSGRLSAESRFGTGEHDLLCLLPERRSGEAMVLYRLRNGETKYADPNTALESANMASCLVWSDGKGGALKK